MGGMRILDGAEKFCDWKEGWGCGATRRKKKRIEQSGSILRTWGAAMLRPYTDEPRPRVSKGSTFAERFNLSIG